MTPEQRIAQLAEQRGGVAIAAPRVIPRPDNHFLPKPRIKGAEAALPQTWKNRADTWDDSSHRQLLMDLETKLAAGVIARCLGDGWRREEDGNCRHVKIMHRDGYGFTFRRDWRDSGRFHASPIDRHKHDEPASITVSAARTLGAIAQDIARRLVNNGLREAYDACQDSARNRREEAQKRFQQIEAVALAFGGRVLGRRSWQADGYPEADIPGGRARIGYGFHGADIELDISMDLETAKTIGQALRESRP